MTNLARLLDELEVLYAKATEGPWTVGTPSDYPEAVTVAIVGDYCVEHPTPGIRGGNYRDTKWGTDQHDCELISKLHSAFPALRDALRGGMLVPRGHLQDALNYIKHCGANAVMRGQPHPQQQIVDRLETVLSAAPQDSQPKASNKTAGADKPLIRAHLGLTLIEPAAMNEPALARVAEERDNYKSRWEICLQQLADEKNRSEKQFKKDQDARLTLHERAIAAEDALEQAEQRAEAAERGKERMVMDKQRELIAELEEGDGCYYITQERAFAPGVADGWPEVIKAPHTENGRLLKRQWPKVLSARERKECPPLPPSPHSSFTHKER